MSCAAAVQHGSRPGISLSSGSKGLIGEDLCGSLGLRRVNLLRLTQVGQELNKRERLLQTMVKPLGQDVQNQVAGV